MYTQQAYTGNTEVLTNQADVMSQDGSTLRQNFSVRSRADIEKFNFLEQQNEGLQEQVDQLKQALEVNKSLQKSLLDEASEAATKIVNERNSQLEKELQKANESISKQQA